MTTHFSSTYPAPSIRWLYLSRFAIIVAITTASTTQKSFHQSCLGVSCSCCWKWCWYSFWCCCWCTCWICCWSWACCWVTRLIFRERWGARMTTLCALPCLTSVKVARAGKGESVSVGGAMLPVSISHSTSCHWSRESVWVRLSWLYWTRLSCCWTCVVLWVSGCVVLQAAKSRSKAKKHIYLINKGLRELVNDYFEFVGILGISGIACGGNLLSQAIWVALVAHCLLVARVLT